MLITLKSDIRPPTAPVLGTPTIVSPTALTVPMTSVATDLQSVASYQLERATVVTGPFSVLSAAATFPYADTGLSAGTVYYYRACATDGSGNVGNYSAIATQTTPAVDTTPNQFTFVDQTGVSLSSTITSAAVTIAGLATGTSVTFTAVGGTIDKNGGSFASSQSLQNGDTMRARVTSSASNLTAVNCVVTATPSGITDTFTATTLASGDVAKPDESNTGPSGTLTPVSGTLTINSSGTYENFSRTGRIQVNASNVTIRNFRVNANGANANCIRVSDSARNVVIEDGEMYGATASMVSGNGFTLRRCNLHDGNADGISCNIDVVIEDCYIWGLGANSPAAHADGLQVTSGDNVIIRRNNFTLDDNATYNVDHGLMIKSDTGDISNVVVEDNWFIGNGAGYAVRFIAANGNQLSGCILRNNRFGRNFVFNPWSGGDVTNNLDIFCGNRWDDTDEIINMDGNAACPV